LAGTLKKTDYNGFREFRGALCRARARAHEHSFTLTHVHARHVHVHCTGTFTGLPKKRYNQRILNQKEV